MLDVACVEVTTETVVNYFEKAGISKEKQPGALLDTDANDKVLWMILSPALSH